MASHQDDLHAAHVHCDRALAQWAGLKEHMIKYFESKMWEALAPEKAHAQWVNVWCVLALLRTYCPAKAVVQCATSLRGSFSSSM